MNPGDPGREAEESTGVDFGEMTARLHEIAEELRSEGVSDERAEQLAREAAELVGEAGNEIERALGESAAGES